MHCASIQAKAKVPGLEGSGAVSIIHVILAPRKGTGKIVERLRSGGKCMSAAGIGSTPLGKTVPFPRGSDLITLGERIPMCSQNLLMPGDG